MGKKVGLVIPSFNQGDFLEAAIKSAVLNKKYADIDIVVMDGGSKDNSIDIIKKYEPELLYWQSRPDGGQANAINMGMEHLRHCDYLMWLNSDDVMDHDSAVNEILTHMINTNAVFCYGKSRYIDKDGNIIGEYETMNYDKLRLGETCYISQPSVMMSSKLWFDLGGLNSSLQMCLDYEMWIRASRKCDFEYLEEFIGNTRLYNETKTATMQDRHLSEGIIVLDYYYGKAPVNWMVCKLRNSRKIFNYIPYRLIKAGLNLFYEDFISKVKKKCDIHFK